MVLLREILWRPKMAEKLDIENFSDNCRFQIVGKLTNEVITFLRQNSNNEILNVLHETDILLWDNRIAYTEKHKGNFRTAEEYYRYLEDIPNIIENPDYIGLPPHDDSIQYIKIYDNIVLVAIRNSSSCKLSYRTMYPILEGQLKDYIRKNRAWKYMKNIDIK